MKYNPPVLLVHGGAGSWKKENEENAIRVIIESLKRGYEEFKKGSALEAVVESIAYLEDSGVFNAGKGSIRNSEGEIEMDAGVMDGKTLDIGAVAVTNIENPIKVAYKILLEKRHSIIGCLKKEKKVYENRSIEIFETVGAVALDTNGRLAAGTSTGGILGKKPGRIGDTPIPGAGYYATSNVAVSSTGIGEIILKVLPAKEVDILVSMGFDLESSLRAVVNKVTNMFGKDNIGLIGIDKLGYASALYNTKGMARGIMSKDTLKAFVFEGEI
jgi:beta-aspartyl-peptidase (threonine type)